MIRFRYRAAIFGAIVALLIAGRHYPELAAWPTAASPFLGVAALIGGGVLIVPALVLAAMCLFRRRILCHSVCPLGFCFNTIDKGWNKFTGSNRLPKFLHAFPRLGVFLAVFTWLGCALGVVGFIWLDPFVMFSSPFHWTNRDMLFDNHWRPYFSPLFWLLLLLLFVEPVIPTFWCRNVCPLGGTQDLLYWPGSVIREARNRTDERPDSERKHRRRLLSRGFSFLFFGGLFTYMYRHAGFHSNIHPLKRPPGALPETTFLTLCTRCGACIQACPTGLLRENYYATSVQDIGSPHVVFRGNFCKHDCNACSLVCPTGAIQKFSVEDKKDIKIGLAVLSDFERCRLYEDVECSICQRDCPYDAVSYEWSEEEYLRIPVIDPKTCTGCGRCVVSCPGLGKNEPKPLKMTSTG